MMNDYFWMYLVGVFMITGLVGILGISLSTFFDKKHMGREWDD